MPKSREKDPVTPKPKRKAGKSKIAEIRVAKPGIVMRAVGKRRTARVAPPSTERECPSPEDTSAFTESLIESGDAAFPDKDGTLPAGATHKIEHDKTGNLKVVRRRFSVA